MASATATQELSPVIYNLYLGNTGTTSIPMEITRVLTRALLQEQHDYDVSVIRFTCPSLGIPLFTMPLANSPFVARLSYGATSVTGSVNFDVATVGATGGAVYYISSWVVMVNKMLVILAGALYAANHSAGNHPPVLSFSPLTQLYTMTYDTSYIPPLPTPVILSLSPALYTKLSGFPYTITPGDAFPYAALVTGATVVSEALGLDTAADVDQVVLTSSLAVSYEWSGASTSSPVLADFALADLTVDSFHNQIVYNAVGAPYRQVPIIGSGTLQTISVRFSTSSPGGQLATMMLPPGASASVKLMFTKRSQSKYA